MSRDLTEVLRRQLHKHERQLQAFGTPDDGLEEPPWPDTMTDAQLAEFRKGIDEELGPGMADWFIQSFEGPLPEVVLDSIPGGFPSREELVAEHDRMRRLPGDLRQRGSDPHDKTLA